MHTDDQTDGLSDARQYHDMGGQDAGPVSPTSHEFEPWEKRIEALVRLMSLRDPPIVTVDELRRGIEQLPPDVYDSITYYEKWIASLTNILVEKGVLDRGELDGRIDDVAARKADDAPTLEKGVA